MLRAGAGRWTGLLFDRRTGAQARLTTATNLQWFVLAGNDITITEVYGITKNSTGGAGVTSYAALPSEVINGNIISIVGDGWYKGIGGVWVRSRQIEKEVPLDTIVAGRQITTSATTRTLSESWQNFSHFKYRYEQGGGNNNPREAIIPRAINTIFEVGTIANVTKIRVFLDTTNNSRNIILFANNAGSDYYYGFVGINYSDGWDA